jgi:hypothetical protein
MKRFKKKVEYQAKSHNFGGKIGVLRHTIWGIALFRYIPIDSQQELHF